ncbi:MAG: diphthine synthase [Candidatus Aenigmarchaeota archaeon]|nr:diphthine synthase [Candidatus Aenigmarchaeota archaeon]MDW8149493.1 diphthine synthase [Candidatus Aenigmarchaeota archaeon]
MLILAGLGLCDELDINLRLIEESKKCDEIYIEDYTGIWKGDIEKLEKTLNKKITKVDRSFLEERCKEIIEKAKEKNIMILIQGDPLVLTTHFSLILECRKNNVKYKIIHNSSIVSAVAKTGLHIQKFGRIVSLHKKFEAQSIKNFIIENKKNKLHTLCILDLDLNLKEAIEILEKLECIKGDEKFFVLVNVGCDDEKIFVGTKELLKKIRIENKSISIVIPSEDLHFTEKEAIEIGGGGI